MANENQRPYSPKLQEESLGVTAAKAVMTDELAEKGRRG